MHTAAQPTASVCAVAGPDIHEKHLAEYNTRVTDKCAVLLRLATIASDASAPVLSEQLTALRQRLLTWFTQRVQHTEGGIAAASAQLRKLSEDPAVMFTTTGSADGGALSDTRTDAVTGAETKAVVSLPTEHTLWFDYVVRSNVKVSAGDCEDTSQLPRAAHNVISFFTGFSFEEHRFADLFVLPPPQAPPVLTPSFTPRAQQRELSSEELVLGLGELPPDVVRTLLRWLLFCCYFLHRLFSCFGSVIFFAPTNVSVTRCSARTL